MDDKNEETLEFLQSLDSRHTQVLDELDALNARIEAVLGAYTQKREPGASESEA